MGVIGYMEREREMWEGIKMTRQRVVFFSFLPLPADVDSLVKWHVIGPCGETLAKLLKIK